MKSNAALSSIGIAPFGPLAGCQRQRAVEHGVEHIHERNVRGNRAVKLRRLVDDRAHQLAAGGAACRGDAARVRRSPGRSGSA